MCNRASTKLNAPGTNATYDLIDAYRVSTVIKHYLIGYYRYDATVSPPFEANTVLRICLQIQFHAQLLYTLSNRIISSLLSTGVPDPAIQQSRRVGVLKYDSGASAIRWDTINTRNEVTYKSLKWVPILGVAVFASLGDAACTALIQECTAGGSTTPNATFSSRAPQASRNKAWYIMYELMQALENDAGQPPPPAQPAAPPAVTPAPPALPAAPPAVTPAPPAPAAPPTAPTTAPSVQSSAKGGGATYARR